MPSGFVRSHVKHVYYKLCVDLFQVMMEIPAENAHYLALSAVLQ